MDTENELEVNLDPIESDAKPKTNPAAHLSPEIQRALFEYTVRLGDDRLILGHRLSEWCGHAPILEEDIALANMALDLIGQASAFLELAGRIEGAGRSEDDLAYFREAVEFRNLLLLEQPRGDFAYTILRQFFFAALSLPMLETLGKSALPELAALAAKSLKESRYHLRHSAEWVRRLGLGTEESRARLQTALDELWIFTGEMFDTDQVETALAAERLIGTSAACRAPWEAVVLPLLQEAGLTIPTDAPAARGGRTGKHSEFLGFLLAEMQIVARSHPGAKW
jgi:ring-1,2-phenylacetyl-CoA epoxidase subunit PaaC